MATNLRKRVLLQTATFSEDEQTSASVDKNSPSTSRRRRHSDADSSCSEQPPSSTSGTPRRRRATVSTYVADGNTRGASLLYRKSSSESGGRILRRRIFFTIGVLLGVLITWTFIKTGPNAQVLESLSNMVVLALADLELSSLVPKGSNLEEFMANLTISLRQTVIGSPGSEKLSSPDMFAIGEMLAKEEGLNATHPVILIPGIISTGLESWGTSDCATKYFRHRMWGTLNMFRAVLLDKHCWTLHMQLDPETGLDPPGVKLRAAQGLDAADYFIVGYWIWGKIIENLAAIGYDNNNMMLASYDWRLSFRNLEVRDSYFSKLKSSIELAVKHSQKKAVIVAHSMGALVFGYFMQWVESPIGGNGGDQWVAQHLESFVNVAGPMLGVPKTIASSLSGEMRDTVQPLGAYILERFYSRLERAKLFRTWGGLASMVPRGGDAVWGDLNSAPDDHYNASTTYGKMIRFQQNNTFLTIDDTIALLEKYADSDYLAMLNKEYSFGVAKKKGDLKKQPKYWSNPLQVALPNARNLSIWCLYGVGKETERGYYYAHDPTLDELWIDTEAENLGVVVGDGDGTVPLISLGYMCADGWRNPLLNPHDVKIGLREYDHSPTSFISDPRGGPGSADHVDILGNAEMIQDILRLAAGKGNQLNDRFISRIKEISVKITTRIME